MIYAAIEARRFSYRFEFIKVRFSMKLYNISPYSPYSKFKVGAAIRLDDGTIFGGCNVENAAYGPSICAERTAICKAVSAGFTEFKAVAVVAFQEQSFTTPCGVCRQFLNEFVKDKDIPIYVCKPEPNEVLVTSINTLLPMSFVPLVPK